MDGIEEGDTKNICVIIICTNAKQHEEKNRRLNSQKADSCSAAHQSGVNDKEPQIDSGEFKVMSACDESALDQWDVFSSEETAV